MLVVTVLITSAAMSPPAPPNLCSTQDLCCPHRSSKCVVQHAMTKPCYCDRTCRHFRDCCPDYRQHCTGNLRPSHFHRYLYMCSFLNMAMAWNKGDSWVVLCDLRLLRLSILQSLVPSPIEILNENCVSFYTF